MITIQEADNLISVAVFGEFTLADFKEFEEQVLYKSRDESKVDVLFDWRDMLGYTVDVAWEDIKFIREHGNDFNRIAIITDNQWRAWGAWVFNLFIDADIRVFSNYADAKAWVRRLRNLFASSDSGAYKPILVTSSRDIKISILNGTERERTGNFSMLQPMPE